MPRNEQLASRSISPLDILRDVMNQGGSWSGPDGTRNHATFIVLFNAWNHLAANEGDFRAKEYISSPRLGSSVGWFEMLHNLNYNPVTKF